MPRLRQNRRFIALVTGLALGLTAIGTNTRADERDIVRALGGIATLYALGKVIEEARTDAQDHRREADLRALAAQRDFRAREAARARRAEEVEPVRHRDRDRWDRGRGRKDWDRYGRGWRHREPAPLPAACLIRTYRGPAVFGARCLERHYRDADRLPKACRVRVEARNDRSRRAYLAPCLRHRGFVTDHRAYRRGW